MRTSQTKRAAIFAQQNKQCALCGRQGISMAGWSYKPDQNAMICKQCNTSLGNYCSALDRGVTPAMMAAFLVREPAPEPIIEAKVKAKPRIKLSPAQLQSRQMVLDGRIPGVDLDEWERRAGVWGTDYAEQYGLDTPTDTDTDTGPETLIVDGERRMAVDGEWVPVDQIEQSNQGGNNGPERLC